MYKNGMRKKTPPVLEADGVTLFYDFTVLNGRVIEANGLDIIKKKNSKSVNVLFSTWAYSLREICSEDNLIKSSVWTCKDMKI